MKSFEQRMAELTPEETRIVNAKKEAMRLESQLYKLREAMHRTQREQARAMGIAQPSVVAIESRGADLKITTLKRYVDALGGQLTFGVTLPGGEHFDFSL